jgi:hypothetical protein
VRNLRLTRSRLLLLALTLLLTLPPGLIAGHESVNSRWATSPGLAAPQDAQQASTAPDLGARKRGDHKAKRRHARQAERWERKERRQERREREQGSQTPEQAQIEAMVEAAPPRIPALSVVDDPCGPGLTQLPKSGRCTHGPDDPPPTGVVTSNQSPLTPAEARRVTANVVCEDDGTSGFRVQVLYLRSSSDADAYAKNLNSIRTWAAGADTILRDSSTAAGQEMGFTFVMTTDCQIDVQNVVISPSAIRTFDATIMALEQQGYDRVNRIYMMFADTSSAGICGIGTIWEDDRAEATNANNRGPSYARADPICWDAHTAAHELMHNLGGVQYSAPHSTGFGHCIDEYDVMCYRDDSQSPPMQFICKPQSTFEMRYDCGNDDYFDPLPQLGSYLATHWNSARNWFLTQDVPPDADLTPPDVSWVAPVGNGQTHEASAGAIPLRAEAKDASGVAYVDFWLYDSVADEWVFLGEDSTAPYTSSVNVSNLRSGLNYLTADAFDNQANWVDEGIWVERTDADPGGVTVPSLSLATSTTSVKAKKSVSLIATVGNSPATGTSVEFRICRGSSCTWDTGQSLGTFSGPSPSTSWKASGKGQVTFVAKVTSETGTVTSNPAAVSVKKAKKKS